MIAQIQKKNKALSCTNAKGFSLELVDICEREQNFNSFVANDFDGIEDFFRQTD